MSSRIIRAGDRRKNREIQPLTSLQSDQDAYARGFEDGRRFGLELAMDLLRSIQNEMPEPALVQASSRFE